MTESKLQRERNGVRMELNLRKERVQELIMEKVLGAYKSEDCGQKVRCLNLIFQIKCLQCGLVVRRNKDLSPCR